ncbi:MAG: hypothetical protein ACI96N_002240 [Arenicella sp.]|jgi:hypothetical protein
MVLMKNRFLIPGSFVFFILLLYLLIADEDLEPATKLWLDVFEQQGDDHNNASLRLLSLGKTDPIFINTAKQTYLKKLNAFKYDGLLGDEVPMKYPNVLQFEPFLQSSLFCELAEIGCFERLREQADYLNLVIIEFEPELSDFMSLNKVEHFQALNPFVAEIKLKDFIFLFKLKGTEIYYDITKGNFEKASNSLEQLITINRQFFAESNDLLAKISFSVNTKNIFQPLLIALKDAGYSSSDKFADVLRPLSMKEISVDEIQKRSFAKNARIIKAGLAAREQQSSDSILSTLWQRFVYKKNMTLNDMYNDYQALLLPSYISKHSLLAFSDSIDQATNERQRDKSQQPIMYRLNNLTNAVGASLKDIVMPRQVNVYKATAALDTRLQLLRLRLQAQDKELAELVKLESYANYYTGHLPFIIEGKACYTINSEDVCVAI